MTAHRGPATAPRSLHASAARSMLKAISALCDGTGLSRSAVTELLLGDPAFCSRIGGGKNFTAATYDRLMGGMAAIWPDDLPWPRDVPRPVPADLPREVFLQVQERARRAQARPQFSPSGKDKTNG